jgi:hypothetical protein
MVRYSIDNNSPHLKGEYTIQMPLVPGDRQLKYGTDAASPQHLSSRHHVEGLTAEAVADAQRS